MTKSGTERLVVLAAVWGWWRIVALDTCLREFEYAIISCSEGMVLVLIVVHGKERKLGSESGKYS